MLLSIFIFALTLLQAKCQMNVNVTETEMFSIPISPQMFNWTYQANDKQYSFHASIFNKPDLPQWLHYVYSNRHHSGFIYGTPPLHQNDITLQIIGLNREDYETRKATISLNIQRKIRVGRFQVQLKIDNLNVEDLLDEYRIEKLKDIFRKKLWKESADDLYTTFMVSAIELGARLPLKPNEGEGVVLKLGSYKPHSSDLLKLQEEVRPLFKLSWCARDFKRTTVERHFRDIGFNLDWCAFRLFELNYEDLAQGDDMNLNLKKLSNTHNNLMDDMDTKQNLEKPFITEEDRWISIAKSEIPVRSYVKESIIIFVAPMFLMIVMVSLLSMVICFHHEAITARNQVSDSKAELSHYHNESTIETDDGKGGVVENKSVMGISPSKNANVAVDYNRPQPPPYLGANTNTLTLRHQALAARTALDDELAAKQSQARALEESLLMLNEANILNPNYHHHHHHHQLPVGNGDVVYEDGAELQDNEDEDDDYVPIKPALPSAAHLIHNGNILRNLDDL